jgi:hypothetical protein
MVDYVDWYNRINPITDDKRSADNLAREAVNRDPTGVDGPIDPGVVIPPVTIELITKWLADCFIWDNEHTCPDTGKRQSRCKYGKVGYLFVF